MERKASAIEVSLLRMNELIGIDIPSVNVCEILNKLGFEVVAMISDTITVIVPSFRFDISIKADVVEEVARVYGYDNIPPILPRVTHVMPQIQELQEQLNYFKSQLVSLGYNEIINYAFLEEKLAKRFMIVKEASDKETTEKNTIGKETTDVGTATAEMHELIKLQNPIANWNVMRNNLFVGLIKTLQYNINRGIKTARLFEVGRVFYGTDDRPESQPIKIAGLITGNYSNTTNYLNPQRVVDFFDIKHDVQMLLSGYKNIRFVADNYLSMHPNRCATIWLEDTLIGVVGQLNPTIGYQFDLVELPYLFELDLSMLQKNVHAYTSRSVDVKITIPHKFPKVERDLAFVVANQIPANNIIIAINKDNIDGVPYLVDMKIFDIYQGDNLPNNMKSIAIKFIFQANKTLTDVEINTSLNIIKNIIMSGFDAMLR
jgi:phenylalanyl-tRNA synthetase beta chain